jgi:urocanate hydratase
LAQANNEIVSIGYLGNVVDVWEKFDQENIHIDLGSDQTSYTILGRAVIILIFPLKKRIV